MVEKSCTQLKGTGDSAFFGPVLPGDMQVEGHTSTGCIYKVEKVDHTPFLNVGQIILNLTRSQTNGAGK